jgi:pimeloyl-ACP methyl ester carboxylesterase
MPQREVEIPPYRFWERREGSGEPVVLLHGLSGSSGWWRRNVPSLSARREVVAVDLVGFGRTRRYPASLPLPLPFDEIAALLARWIDDSFDRPVHLVGHSMGGQIAAHLAAARPELVRSLTLVSATGIPFRLDPRAHLAALRFPSRDLFAFLPVLALDLLRAGPFSIALASARLLRDDAREALRAVRAPTMLAWGESDALVPVDYAQEILSLLPEARLEVIPRSSHVPMWENAGEFNRIL